MKLLRNIRSADTSVYAYLIGFDCLTLKMTKITLINYHNLYYYSALKNANLSQENERLVRAIANEINVKVRLKQLKIMRIYSSEKIDGCSS